MATQVTLTDILLPSELRAREIEAPQMFGRRTVWAVYAIAGSIGVVLWLHAQFHRTALLAPLDPTFHAIMIGTGVFVGVLLAAVEHDGWRLGIGKLRGRVPTGLFAALCMLVLIIISGADGHYVAGQLVEWRAFHGLKPPSEERPFIVVRQSITRGGDWLELREPGNSYTVSVSSGPGRYPVSTGEHLLLPVQAGRGAVRRLTLPPAGDVHRL